MKCGPKKLFKIRGTCLSFLYFIPLFYEYISQKYYFYLLSSINHVAVVHKYSWNSLNIIHTSYKRQTQYVRYSCLSCLVFLYLSTYFLVNHAVICPLTSLFNILWNRRVHFNKSDVVQTHMSVKRFCHTHRFFNRWIRVEHPCHEQYNLCLIYRLLVNIYA